MSMTAMASTGGHVSQRNWRRTMLYAFELVFALIAGSSEATIYYGYSPASPWAWTRVAEAIFRAAITQVCVVFFAVAAVEASARMRSIPGKIAAAFPAWIATLIAALITFWMMRGAALIFRDAALLAPAEQGGIWLPILGYVSNQSTDIVIVAAIPFFQLGLNVLAPIIAASPLVETAEDRHERMQREVEEAQHKAEMRALNAGGWGRTLRAGIDAAKQVASSGETGGDTQGNEAGEGGALAVAIQGDRHAQSQGDDARETGGKGGASTRRGFGQKAVPSHMMSAPQFRAYLRENGVHIPADKAVAYVQSVAGCEKIGTMYAAPRRALMPIANRLIDRAQTQGNDATDDGALAG